MMMMTCDCYPTLFAQFTSLNCVDAECDKLHWCADHLLVLDSFILPECLLPESIGCHREASGWMCEESSISMGSPGMYSASMQDYSATESESTRLQKSLSLTHMLEPLCCLDFMLFGAFFTLSVWKVWRVSWIPTLQKSRDRPTGELVHGHKD